MKYFRFGSGPIIYINEKPLCKCVIGPYETVRVQGSVKSIVSHINFADEYETRIVYSVKHSKSCRVMLVTSISPLCIHIDNMPAAEMSTTYGWFYE